MIDLFGVHKRLSIYQAQRCEDGQGKTCHCRCGGGKHGKARGAVTKLPIGDPHSMKRTCPRCAGKGSFEAAIPKTHAGRLVHRTCPTCKGQGYILPRGWVIKRRRLAPALAVLLALAGLSTTKPALATHLPEESAIRAVIGEAEDQGFTGMTMVAEALRNRGHLNGVYGLTAITVKRGVFYRGDRRIDDRIVALAHRAWAASINTNLTHGATHWENIRAFGRPHWATDQRAAYRDHVFYKA